MLRRFTNASNADKPGTRAGSAEDASDIEPWKALLTDRSERVSFHRERIRTALTNTSKEIALSIYVDLCKIACHSSQSEPPILSVLDGVVNCKDSEEMERASRRFIANGRICEMVADCVEHPDTESRRILWKRQCDAWHEMKDEHAEHTSSVNAYSTFVRRTYDRNRAAYDQVRDVTLATREESTWQNVIACSPESLCRKSSQFWNNIKVSSCEHVVKQALCHKLLSCRQISAFPSAIITLRDRIMRDLYAVECDGTYDEGDDAPGACEASATMQAQVVVRRNAFKSRTRFIQWVRRRACNKGKS